MKLTGVKLKMSSAFHPETDGSLERLNKTVKQCVWYYIERNQKGWSKALPKIHCDIMNSINASTGMSMFQLKIGCSPCVLPPIVSSELAVPTPDRPVVDFVKCMELVELEAKDGLLAVKVQQAFQANRQCGDCDTFQECDLVMLSTLHCQNGYKKAGECRAAKFFPQLDGPYTVVKAFPKTSLYTLDLPNQHNAFPSFHVNVLKCYHLNDDSLFPGCATKLPKPTIVDGHKEYEIERILNSCR